MKTKFSIINWLTPNVVSQFSILNSQFSIILLFAAILAGCIKDPVDNPDNPDNPVNVVMQDIALTGMVKDANGNPLDGVNVTTGTLNATTGSDGTFSFSQAGTVDDRAVVKFEKSGYFSLTRSGDKQDEMYMEPMMYRKGNDSITLQTTFDASAAKTLQIGGVKIELPASCFTNANGSAYSGTVHADVLNLGSGNANRALMMPGGDLACNKSDEMVLPIGMMDAIFTDNAGNLLKIKDKTDIPISFPAPSGATNLPLSVPLWTFDEPKGIWVEEGSVSLQGNSYTGTVSHFTNHAVGNYGKQLTLKIHAAACNKPAANAMFLVNFLWIGGEDDFASLVYYDFNIFVYTNSKGDCFVDIPVDNDVAFHISGSYKGEIRDASIDGIDEPIIPFLSFVFDDECNGLFPEKLAVKKFEGAVEYVSYDNYGLRTRYDSGEDLGFHLITISDYVDFHSYGYSSIDGKWGDQSIDPGSTDWTDMRSPLCTSYPIEMLTNRNKDELALYYTQKPDSTIAGKTCKVYLSKGGGGLNGTVMPAGYDRLFYWGRVLMRNDNGGHGTLYYEIRAITEDVPEAAFSKTLPHPWIQ